MAQWELSNARFPVILCGGVFFLIGALFAGIAAYTWIQDSGAIRKLRAEGESIQGTVLRKSIHADEYGENSETSFRISYWFRVPQGNEISDSAKLDVSTWERLKNAGTVEVVYLPADPSIHRVEGQERDVLFIAVFGGIGLVFALVGGLMLMWTFRELPPFALAALGLLTRAPMLTFATLWLIVAVPFLIAGPYAFVSQRAVDAKFKTEAARIDGVVLSKEVVRKSGTGRDSGTTYTSYRVTFRYAAPTGDEIVGSADLNSNVWDRLAERGPIAVTYLPDQPWIFRVGGGGTGWAGPLLLSGFGFLGSLIGGTALFFGLRTSRAARGGSRPAKAKVIRSLTPRVRAVKAAPPRAAVQATESRLTSAAAAGLLAIPGISSFGGDQQRSRWLVPRRWLVLLIGIV